MAARVRLSLALLAFAVIAGAATPVAAARTPMTIGLQSWRLPTDDVMTTVATGGIRGYRMVFDWSAIRATRARNDWSAYDDAMASAAKAGVRVLPVLLGCAPHVCRDHLQPPTSGRRSSGWSAFAAAVARRYGRGGAFWKAHPELAPMPVVAYQVWNEPNLDAYWGGHPDPAAYVRLVARTRTALRRVDPAARVVLAGLAQARSGVRVTTYLTRLYHVGGARAAFDVVAVNAFARTGSGVVDGIGRVRRLMEAAHDARTPLWVTEIGWSTSGPRNPFRVTRRRQASFVGGVLRTLRSRPARERIAAAYLFCLQDRPLRLGERDWFGPHAGLFDLAGRPKPAWAAVAAVAGGSAEGQLDPVPDEVSGG